MPSDRPGADDGLDENGNQYGHCNSCGEEAPADLLCCDDGGRALLTPDTPLSIELVPSTCWYTNVRSHVSAAEWEACKRFVRTRSGGSCEICNGVGSRWPVECHEVWDYDDQAKVQRLLGLIALCPACHRCKHLGRTSVAETHAVFIATLEHLMRVNGWDSDTTERYVQHVFAMHVKRSRYQWTLDISYLTEVLGP